MRNKIRKLIIETIGDIESESKYFGADLVNGLRNDEKLKKTVESHGAGLDEFIQYLKNTYGLNFVGKGFFRVVFTTPNDDLIIKFAKNSVMHNQFTKGKPIDALEVNLQEISLFNRYPEFFPKLYAYDPDGLWMIVQKAKNVINSPWRFVETICDTFSSFGELSKIFKKEVDFYARKNLNKAFTELGETDKSGFNYLEFYNLINEIDFENNDYPFYRDYGFLFNSILNNYCTENMSLSESLDKATSSFVLRLLNGVALNIPWGTYQNNVTLQLIDEITADKMYQKLSRLIFNDRYFVSFLDMIKVEKISTFDIGPHNVGTNDEGKLIILDATSF